MAVLEIPDFSHLAVHPSILFFFVVECVKDFDVCLVLVESVSRWAMFFLHGYCDDRRHKYLCHYRRSDVFLAEW